MKSTLSNLVFGNVLAAAGRDYKKVIDLLPNFGELIDSIFVVSFC